MSDIREIRVHRVELPAVRGYRMSRSAVETPLSTVVEVLDEEGRRGYGEACLAGKNAQPQSNDGVFTAVQIVARAVIGLDPMQLGVVHAAMDDAADGQREAKAAIDIACWDLIGKRLDVAISDLIGGARMDPVPTYHVVGIASPHDAATEATALISEGHTRLQLKAGGRPIGEDIESIHAVARVVEEASRTTGKMIDLTVDTNRGWTTTEARYVAQACSELRLSFEQPCASLRELRQLRPHLPHPLIVDESAEDVGAIAELIADGIADGFGVKLSRVGGVSAMRAVRDLCAAARVPISTDDAWGGDIVAAAAAHIGSTLDPALTRGAWISFPYHGVHYDPANGPRIENGHVTLPSGPGLGLAIAEDLFGAPEAVIR